MIQLILAGLGFSIWTIYVIITYYSRNYSSIDHLETATGYEGYLFAIIILYGLYKVYTLFFSGKRIVKYNFLNISLFAILHLLVVCIAYTSLQQGQLSSFFAGIPPSSMVLFSHSIGLLIYPVILVIILRALGSTILGLTIENWTSEKLRFRFPIELTTGFFVFSFLLLILGAFGVYNLSGLLILLAILVIVSYPGLKRTYEEIKNTSVTYANHSLNGNLEEAFSPRLLSAEIAFIVVTFLINVSLINAIRPMPIGWDDLGAYMNFPKIMALSGEYILGAGMYAWQMITGTGYLFSYTAAQAFYVNQLGGILAVIGLTCALSLLFETKNKIFFISLPIIFATIFYAMPMNIFQQAKDMKLDPAFLFISISTFLTLYRAYEPNNSEKQNVSYILLAGILIGFAFSVKFTALMLIIMGPAYIAYRLLSVSGFFGFFFLFLATFTKLGLWKQMNVWLPLDKPGLLTAASALMLAISIFSFTIAFYTHGEKPLKKWGIGTLLFLLGVFIGVSPWLIKNGSEVGKDLFTGDKTTVINAILGGSGGNFRADFAKVYTESEYKEKQESEKNASITSDGKSLNEDFGRYFGYEKGLNNYLKLPANLTFQKNQPGEFTDITFIFLAFIPAILLFVRGRKFSFPIGISLLLSGMYFYYFSPAMGEKLTNIFGLVELPLGYIFILVFNTIFILFSHFAIEDSDENKKLKEIIFALGIYGFLFWISAFGIVWYGILVYFLFLSLIGLSSMNFTAYTEEEKKDENLMSVKITLTVIFLIFIFAYFLRSSLPHGWNNLKEASYNEFKYNILNQEESIFAYRQDYVTPIATMNIADLNKLIKSVESQATSKELKELFTSGKLDGVNIREFAYILFSLSNNKKNLRISEDASRLGNILFKAILYPSKDMKNNGGIYRIGTFMTYLIDRNRQRFFDDSLVFSFETYFYDPSPEATIDRMKKMGFKYLLIDLNAATIDKDPRHALTTRFEHLLHTMKARNLKLVDTDNLCLRFAIDMYKNGELQDPNAYIDVAGTNYESYRTMSGSEIAIARYTKQLNCNNTILRTLYSGEDGVTKYPYLAPLKEAIDSEKALGSDPENQKKLQRIFSQFFGQSWFVLFEVSNAPKLAEPVNTPTTNTGSSAGTGQLQK